MILSQWICLGFSFLATFELGTCTRDRGLRNLPTYIGLLALVAIGFIGAFYDG